MPHSGGLDPRLLAGIRTSGLLVALFDEADTLRFANPAYAEMFLRGLILPVHFADVLRHGFDNGFGVHIASGDVEAFLADVLPRRRLAKERVIMVDTVDGKWLQFVETALPDGWLLTIASDVSALKQRERHFEHLHASAMREAITDVLTGVANRRHILQLAASAIGQYAGTEEKLSIAVIDIDHFKRINDSRGHHVGDQVLKQFCEVCTAQLRPTDALGRIGGEEFLLLLGGVDAVAGCVVIDRIRDMLALGAEHRFSFSAGIAEPRLGETLDDVMQRADAALYVAKRSGRSCTRLAIAAGASDPD